MSLIRNTRTCQNNACLFLIIGRQCGPLLWDYPRAPFCALHQHFPNSWSPTRHWDDVQARLRRFHLWNLPVLPNKQQWFLPSYSLHRAKEIGALPRRPVPRYPSRYSRHHSRRLVVGHQRRSHPCTHVWARGRSQKGEYCSWFIWVMILILLLLFDIFTCCIHN